MLNWIREKRDAESPQYDCTICENQWTDKNEVIGHIKSDQIIIQGGKVIEMTETDLEIRNRFFPLVFKKYMVELVRIV